MDLHGVWQDIAFMQRSCRRQPGFALTALATLALGIGACTAVFSVVNAVILRPVPYPDPERIVLVGTNTGASAPKLAAWAQATDVFTELAAYRGGRVNVTTTDDLQHALALQVPYAQADVNFFSLFGAAVEQGRGFTVDDDRPHAGRVVLLSHRFWQRHFDGDPAIIGRRVLLDNDPHTVIGVLSERFDPQDIAAFAYWGIPELWAPLQLDRQSLNQGNDMLAAARLAPGATLDMARDRLRGIAADFRRTFPGVLLPNVEFGVKSIHGAVAGDARTSLWLLTGAVGFVLLITCANVANLLLARATARGREIAIRTAIGAGRARIVSQHRPLGPVSPGYFEVLKIPLRRGRLFTERDGARSPPVVIISESLARQFFPDGEALGQQLVLGKGLSAPFETEPVRQIVGVVGDVHDSELSRAPAPTTYIPQAQVSDGLMAWIARATFTTWVVRTGVEPYALATSIGRTLQEASQGVPVSDVRSMDDVLSQSRTRPTFNTVVLTIFGGAALLLATIGIYGLMSYAVQQRIREIGIRIALGAGTDSVRRMVIWQGMRVVLPGVAIGLVAAYAMTRVLSGFLFGVGAHDPATFVAVPVLLAIVAFISVWLGPVRQ